MHAAQGDHHDSDKHPLDTPCVESIKENAQRSHVIERNTYINYVALKHDWLVLYVDVDVSLIRNIVH